MSTLLTLLSLLLPFTMGFLVVSIFWQQGGTLFSDLPLKCCLSVGIGFGSASCLVFAWMMSAGQLSRGVFIVEFLLLLAVSVWFTVRRRSSIAATTAPPPKVPIPSPGKPYLLRLAVGIVALVALVNFCYLSLQDPHGQIDAYAMWNLRARFLERGGHFWKDFRYMTWSHPDYPKLVPISVAASWKFVGREIPLIPILIALLFTAATIGVVAIATSRLRGERQGLLAGLVLLGTPFLIIHGAAQYADVPLCFFFSAAVALLFFHSESPSTNGYLILAGMAAAFSAWTKNEGILFMGVLFFLHFAVTCAVKGRNSWRAEVLPLLMGAAPVIAILVIYKVFLAASNDLLATQGLAATFHKLLEVSRYRVVVGEFFRAMPSFGRFGPISTIAIPVMLFFYFLLLGTHIENKHLSATAIAVLLPTFMMIGYLFIYIISPLQLEWHLATSLSRLFLQVWPLAVLAYFAIVQAPERAMAEPAIPSKVGVAGI